MANTITLKTDIEEMIEEGNYPYTLTLKKPIEFGDTLYSTITIKDEPTADIAIFAGDQANGGAGTMGVLTLERWLGVDETVLRKLSMREFAFLSEVLSAFLPNTGV